MAFPPDRLCGISVGWSELGLERLIGSRAATIPAERGINVELG
jgi:hypothetical protein